LLIKNTDPDALSLSFALGVTLGLFPIVGTTAIICGIVAYFFRLNQPGIQLINLLVAPLEILCVPFFLHLGESVLGRAHVSLSPDLVIQAFKSNFVEAIRDYGVAILHAIFGWALFVPLATLILFLLFRPAVRRAKAWLFRND